MELRLNLSGLVRYLTAADRNKIAKAREIRAQAGSDYSPGTDHWRQMRVAMDNDRRTVRDGSLVTAVVEETHAKRRPSYAIVAERWPAIAERWQPARFHRPTGADLFIGGLDVAVKPLFSERWPDGSVEDVTVWMNLEEPSDAAVRGALRLLTRADPEPASIATFVDVRRSRAWSSTDEVGAEIDEWLDDVGARFLIDAQG